MKNTPLLRSIAAVAASTLLLAACGGGGGGGSETVTVSPVAPLPPVTPAVPATTTTTTASSTPLGPSKQYEGVCDIGTQKRFVRAYLDEMYLWYNEVPEVNPDLYNTIPDYFSALLVRTPDASGKPRDRFSTVLPTYQAKDVLQQSFAPQSRTTALLANHTNMVPVVKTVTSPSGRLAGYIQFNDHELGAQDDLISAFRQIRDAGVQDLVLDLRFNNGGYLYIAQTAASMIAGPSAEGKVFERLRYNDKRQAETEASTMTFSSRVQYSESQYPTGATLPQLNLSRVFVLTSGNTCSASESIINGLRGIDVQVIRVGNTTCGKPYGFRQKNNCGWAYFPIEFQGTNAKGEGDYTSGIQPTCRVQDNTSVAAGEPGDPLLQGALTYMDTGACPASTATGVQSAGTPRVSSEQAGRPTWAGRLLLPQQR